MSLSKLQKMQRFVPSLYKPYHNPGVRGLLYAWSGEDDEIVAAAQDAKEQLFVALAQLTYLDALGSNVGVFRPTEFNLSDSLFRQLIPAMSYYPKQVMPTIKAVLDVFFGANNPKVLAHEIRPNQIELQIPASIPALRRDLRGAHHFHNYSGVIDSIDNLLKEMTVSLDGDTKSLKVDELAGGFIGQDRYAEPILSNSIGDNNVTLQFSAGTDISVFTASERFVMSAPNYPGSFIPDATTSFTTTKQRGVLGQTITAGTVAANLNMQDASGIPDAPGYVVFNFGFPNQESLIKYFGRPNNSTILIDPAYIFTFDHAVGELINVIATPYQKPNKDGTAARILAQEIVESIIAAGVVINWTIVGPEIEC
jgi:hypothetical protein